MKDPTIPCRFCKRELKPLKKGSTQIIFCKICKSEEWIEKDGSHYSWSFIVGPYQIGYYYSDKTVRIAEVKNGNWQKWIVSISAPEEPTHITPETMTEERVKCIITFS